MHNDRAKKYLTIILTLGLGIILLSNSSLRNIFSKPKAEITGTIEPWRPAGPALDLVRAWKNREALTALDKILAAEPNNLEAIWGRAEVFRRSNQNVLAELMFKEILNTRPGYSPALTSLAWISYKKGDFNRALALLNQALIASAANRQNQAQAYLVLGLINNDLPAGPGIVYRINRGWKIRNYFLKAAELAPELPETHFYLGLYCLNASFLEGGNLDNAIRELECALNIAPEFPGAKPALDQAYKKKSGNHVQNN